MATGARALCAGAMLLALAGGRVLALDAVVGFGGMHRTGDWTPIVVSVPADATASHADWHVWVEDPDGQWVRSPRAVVTPGGDAIHLRFRARFGRPGGGLKVEASGDEAPPTRPFVATPPALAGGETVMLVIGELEAAERASRLMAREDGTRPRVIRVAHPRDLAVGAAGMTARDFDGIDVIVACGNALADAADGLSQEVIAAIDGWVRGGGRLVFIAGESAARATPQGSPQAAWLPGPPGAAGRVERLVPLRRAAAIETFAHAARPLDKGAIAGIEVPLLADPGRLDGTVLAFEGRAAADLPLIVRFVRGFGTITWLGLDVDGPAFRTWQGTDTLIVELLGGGATHKGGRAGEAVRGGADLAGQLRIAIDNFPGVAPVPFELIAGLGLLYVACLYPLDWWLTSRGGSRAALAWLTLPLLVAAFSGLAWGAGRRWKGTEWRSSAAGIVDVELVDGLARGRSWSGTWSTDNAALDVVASPTDVLPVTDTDVAVSWCAAAGRGLGATDAPAAHPALGAADYAYAGGLAELAGVPIAADASRLFEADWTARRADATLVVALERDAQAALRGMIESRLPFALEGCVLVHAGWLYDVGRLEPGARFEPAAGRGPRSLAGAITRRAAAKERDVAERWDTTSTDIERILEVAGFHRAAGGRSYTSLDPGRLGRLDLSPVLDTGRAVLVGRGPAGTEWRVTARRDAGSSTVAPPAGQTAVWRFVLPLERSGP